MLTVRCAADVFLSTCADMVGTLSRMMRRDDMDMDTATCADVSVIAPTTFEVKPLPISQQMLGRIGSAYYRHSDDTALVLLDEDSLSMRDDKFVSAVYTHEIVHTLVSKNAGVVECLETQYGWTNRHFPAEGDIMSPVPGFGVEGVRQLNACLDAVTDAELRVDSEQGIADVPTGELDDKVCEYPWYMSPPFWSGFGSLVTLLGVGLVYAYNTWRTKKLQSSASPRKYHSPDHAGAHVILPR